MSTRNFLPFAAPPNVIGVAELAYQRRMLRLRHRWQRWIGRVVLLAAMILFGVRLQVRLWDVTSSIIAV